MNKRIVGPNAFRQGFATGVVVAKHHPKTIRVAVRRRLLDTKYENIFTRKSLLKVHDELNESSIGDLVIIRQSRPHSKTKFFEVVDIAIKSASAGYLEEHPDIKEQMEEITRAHNQAIQEQRDSERKTLRELKIEKKQEKIDKKKRRSATKMRISKEEE